MKPDTSQPSNAFIAASWTALVVGISAYLIGLWNASLLLSEKGYYLTVLLYGLFAAVSIQKSVRDQDEGIPVTALYLGLSWASVLIAIVLLVVGLWNATMLLSEKGFYGMAFVLSLFAAITVQKNTRDQQRGAGHHLGVSRARLGGTASPDQPEQERGRQEHRQQEHAPGKP